jgi:DNA-binding transcriptional LysR family regulator
LPAERQRSDRSDSTVGRAGPPGALRLADLADETWTAPSHDGIIARACRAAGFEPRIAIVTSDPLAIRAVVHAGL